MVYLRAIAACLQRIRKADGYLTDAGSLVTLEPLPVLSEDDAPFIAVLWSRQERATDPARVQHARLTTVQVICKVPSAIGSAKALLDDMVTDIETALERQYAGFPRGYEFPKFRAAEPLTPANPADGWTGVLITLSGHIPIRDKQLIDA